MVNKGTACSFRMPLSPAIVYKQMPLSFFTRASNIQFTEGWNGKFWERSQTQFRVLGTKSIEERLSVFECSEHVHGKRYAKIDAFLQSCYLLFKVAWCFPPQKAHLFIISYTERRVNWTHGCLGPCSEISNHEYFLLIQSLKPHVRRDEGFPV